MSKRLLDKTEWAKAEGAAKKPKRLKLIETDDNLLIETDDNLYTCPVHGCDSEAYKSKRGCRKHVFTKHGWYYYFDTKPNVADVIPETCTRKNTYKLPQRSCTSTMPMFLKTCTVAKSFVKWLTSPGGGGKGLVQADQIVCKVLKYAKYCCEDVSPSWDIPLTVIDYCLGSVKLLSDFVEYLQDEWKVGFSGVIGYLNSIGHILDYRRSEGIAADKVHVFIASEVFLQRVKKFLARKMRVEWNTLLNVDYLETINCWATLQDLQKVIPYHSDKYKQIVMNSNDHSICIPAHDLSFATSFIVAILFLVVKASRPMTYQYLTVNMIKSVGNDGIIDQTIFKTQEKYSFDTLMFSKDVLTLINGYINYVRPRLNPQCDYLLVCRKGNQITKLGNIFGRIVYLAIGKYVTPTRYRQIIETESAKELNVTEQEFLSQDQKQKSRVAKVHYQKIQSRIVAERGKECMKKLCDNSATDNSITTLNNHTSNSVDFATTANPETLITGSNGRRKKVPFSPKEDEFILSGLKKYGTSK